MRLILFLLIALILPTELAGQSAKPLYNPLRLIPVAQLQADFRLMRSALEHLHPSLYWYTPKDTMDAVFDRTYAAMTQPLSEQQFINLLYPALCQIRCGHTQLEHSIAYSQSPGLPKAVHLPFDVFVRGEQAWLLATPATDSTLQSGSELVSINDVPIVEVIHAGLNSWNGDGYNQTWKEFFLNEYDFFDVVCRTVYGWKGPYKLQLKQPDGRIRTVMIATKPPVVAPKLTANLSGLGAKALVQQQTEDHKRAHLNLKFLPDSLTAVLTVNGLEYGDEAFYKQAFQQIERKRITNVVLDIRRNHGGDGRIINNLFSYLADSNYVFLTKIRAKTANPGRNPFAAHFDPGMNASYAATFNPGRKSGDWYTFDLKPKVGHLTGYQSTAKQHRFRGNLYVLIDGGTFSNGSNFAASLKAQRQKTAFIGRETGGTESGCGGGTNNKLTLPNSGLVLQFPWMRLVSASKNPVDGHGVMPDYPVEYTVKAIEEHRDLDLEKALILIRDQSAGRGK